MCTCTTIFTILFHISERARKRGIDGHTNSAAKRPKVETTVQEDPRAAILSKTPTMKTLTVLEKSGSQKVEIMASVSSIWKDIGFLRLRHMHIYISFSDAANVTGPYTIDIIAFLLYYGYIYLAPNGMADVMLFQL